MRLLPSVIAAKSVQVSHRRPTPAFSWPQWRGSCLGPGFRVFSLHVNRPTSQCCSVSQYIGRKCISGLGGALCPVARGQKGTKQQEIAHSSCCYWRVLVVRPTNLLSQQVSNRVVHRRRLAKHFQNRVWADGMGGTCQPQIVALPSGASVPRTDQKVQQNQGPGSHKPLSIARANGLRADCDIRTCAAMGHRSTLIARHVGTTVKG